MSRADIVYLVEHIARELDIACAVKSLARLRHGLEIDVRSIVYDLDRPQPGPPPCALVVPFFGSRKSYGVRKAVTRFHGAAAVNLQFEQIISPGNAPIKGPRDHFALTHVLHCAMGDFFADFLRSRGALPENLILTGSLPCQLYRAPYRRFYEGRRAELAARHGLDPARRWIFFPENFAAAFFSQRQLRHRRHHGFNAADLEDYCRHTRHAFQETMSWCAEAARLENAEVIIRPRPSTPRAAFLSAFCKVAGPPPERRLHFITEHSVREWVIASDATVSSFSTTLLEAAVAGKPAFLLAPEPLPASMHSQWHQEAPPIRERREFLELAGAAKLEPARRLEQWADRNLLANGDPIANVVDLLADIAAGRRSAPALRLSLMRRHAERLYHAYKATSRDLRAVFRPRRDKYHERDRFTQEEVMRRTARWDEVLHDAFLRKKVA